MTTDLLTPVTPTNRTRGTALILLASVCFGTSGPLAKPIMDAGVSPQQVATVRIGLAAAVLLVVIGLTRPEALRVPKASWRVLLAYGLVGVAGVQVLYFAAVARIPIGIAMLLEFTAPILVALWVRFVRGTVLPAQAWIGTILALFGLALVAQVWEGLAFDAIGLLAGIGAAFGAASYFLLGERAVTDMEPLGLVTWGMVIGAAILVILVPPWTIPFDKFSHTTNFGRFDPPVWTLVLAIVVVSTAVAYLLSITSMQHLPSTVVSVLALLEPIVATTMAWAFLGQSLAAIQLLGAVVLLSGATLVQLASPRAGLIPE